MAKVKLSILGLSNSQSQTGAYALILAEEGGQRRLPIIIGAFEAQSIALQLEGLYPPRPLTHDLFFNFARQFDIELTEVLIHKLEEGIFYSLLICKQGEKILKIDARTSDAVSLALRFKCPIFTNEDILKRAGIFLDPKSEQETHKEPIKKTKTKESEKWSELTLKELNDLLAKAIEKEDYEQASRLKNEIEKRQKQ